MTTLRAPRRANASQATTLARVVQAWVRWRVQGGRHAESFRAMLVASLPAWAEQRETDPRFAWTLGRLAPSVRRWCRAASVDVPAWLDDLADAREQAPGACAGSGA